MRQTSILAFHSVRKSLSNRQMAVYRAIENIGPANNRMIADYLNYPINQITPRTNELVTKGKVIEAYRDFDPVTQRKSIFWSVKPTYEKEYGDEG